MKTIIKTIATKELQESINEDLKDDKKGNNLEGRDVRFIIESNNEDNRESLQKDKQTL